MGFHPTYTSAMSTILIVDDDADLLRGLAIGLGAEQFRVLTAQSGEEAIEIAEREGPDLIILDVSLPA